MIKKKKLDFSPFNILVYVIMICALVIYIVPFWYMIVLSISEANDILANRVGLLPVGFSLEAYIQIFTYPNFFEAYGNTFIYTIGGTIIAMFMSICFAYPLSKNVLYGHGIVKRLVIFSMYFTGGLIPTYLIIANLGLTGTRFAMLLPFAINQFNLILLINFFRGIPTEIEEAALIDGLNYIGILRRIVLPLSTAAIATIALYYAVFFWNDWFNSLIYLNSSQYPVMMFLRNIVNGTAMVGDGAGAADRTTIGISIKSAVIIVATLPIIVIYPFLQKYFVKGLTVGSVKG